MEDREMLHAIVQADSEARRRVDAAKRREQLLSGSRSQIYAAAEQKAMAKAQQELNELCAQVQEASDRRIAALEKEKADSLRALDREFEAKKADCIDRIFRAVVDAP